MMVHECQVKCIFLSKVISYQVDWLHMIQERVRKDCDHAPDQCLGLLVQTLYDLIFLTVVGDEVFIDHIIFNQCLYVELLLED